MGARRGLREGLRRRRRVARDSWQRRLISLSATLQRWDRRTRVGKIRHLRRALERYSALGISNMAATLSYYLIFAIFPFAMFLTWFIARFGGGLITPEMLANFRSLVPDQVRLILNSLFGNLSGSATVAMASVGILALLWSSSRGFAVMVYTMDLVYENKRSTATYFIQQFLSLMATLGAGIIMMLMLLSMAFGSYLVSLFNELFDTRLFFGAGLSYLNYTISWFLLSLIFSLIYHLCSKRRGKYRYAFVSGLASGLFWVLVTFLFSVYLRSSTRYSLLYGSLTGIIVLMLWLYLCATILLVMGFVHSELLRIKNRSALSALDRRFIALRQLSDFSAPVGVNCSAQRKRRLNMGSRRGRR